MIFSEVKQKINTLKKNTKGYITNFYPGLVDDKQEVEFMENEQAIVFIIQERFRKRCFFAYADEEAFVSLLLKVPSNTILEFVSREPTNPLEEVFDRGNMNAYATYIRKTECYVDNPYQIPGTGRRALLSEMYDPNCGEYPTMEAAEELDALHRQVFDPLCDDMYTIDEWKEKIDKKEILVYRENGKIMAYYCFCLEGRKLYSNISVNTGNTNILYNMERRIFEEMWDRGIRVYYAWFNEKNDKALRRENKNAITCIKSRELLYNFIYIKK